MLKPVKFNRTQIDQHIIPSRYLSDDQIERIWKIIDELPHSQIGDQISGESQLFIGYYHEH